MPGADARPDAPTPSPSPPVPQRLYTLDALRGLAALSVVFWHWQHFFYHGTRPGRFIVEGQPLYGLFFPLYLRGWLAVDLFFCLSGFVFYWLYAARIRERRIPARDFIVLRLSRLYPLHLATLLVVAGGQAALYRAVQSYWVFPWNDAYHFALNLLFASSWGWQKGFSFNAPVWSVSVEVFLYALFFAVSRLLPARAWVPALLCLFGYAVVERLNPGLGRGVTSFFCGGCAFLLYQQVARRGLAPRLAKPLLALAAGLWLLVALEVRAQWPVASLCRFALFPLTLLALALMETAGARWARRLAFLGDISYSSYLWNFPLQLAFIGVAVALDLPQRLFYSPVVLLAFVLLLIAVSAASHYLFEVPARDWIRRRAIGRGPRVPG